MNSVAANSSHKHILILRKLKSTSEFNICGIGIVAKVSINGNELFHTIVLAPDLHLDVGGSSEVPWSWTGVFLSKMLYLGLFI